MCAHPFLRVQQDAVLEAVVPGNTIVTMYFVSEGLEQIKGSLLDPIRTNADVVTIGYPVDGWDGGVEVGSAFGVEWYYYPSTLSTSSNKT